MFILIYYTLHFSAFLHQLNSFAPARNKGNCPLLLPILHLFTSSTILSSLPNPFLWLASLRVPKKLKSEGARSGLCGSEEETSIRVFIYSPHQLTTPLLGAPEHSHEKVFFRGAAVASGTIKIN
jgi:hypothetical protein